SAVKLAEAGTIVASDGGGSVTTARTESRSTPAIARMLAVPSPVASTSPPSTVATSSSDDTHVIGIAAAGFPNASVKEVVSRVVSPTCSSSGSSPAIASDAASPDSTTSAAVSGARSASVGTLASNRYSPASVGTVTAN